MSICMFGNDYLPIIIIVSILLSATAKRGRHSAAFALGSYGGSPSGWPEGFNCFINLLPSETWLMSIRNRKRA
ncbi:hypothetical protein Clacol_003197 [Clathrus columnatus]|uniref:Secreted protein n=1 Tax=Clathrus columnatus TaxID=1419009 RepID=A0AAV5A8U0_9AGAM|nr:hypothetical protein Clacol_003197 [Clathrus columnatus]